MSGDFPSTDSPATRYDAAFLCLFIDLDGGRPEIKGAGTFSSPHPTTMGNYRWIHYLTGRGTTYPEGLAEIGIQLQSPGNQWLIPLLEAAQ